MKMKRNGITLFLLVAMLFAALGGSAAADNISAQIPVEIALTGAVPKQAETFTVILTREEGWFPMPEGSIGDSAVLEITGAGADVFVIPCPGVGVFHYTVRQEPGTHTRGTYDDEVYHVTVTCFVEKETGELRTITAIHKEGQEEKPDSCVFENRYARQPGSISPQTDDNSGIRLHQTLTAVSGAVLLLLFLTRKEKHRC